MFYFFSDRLNEAPAAYLLASVIITYSMTCDNCNKSSRFTPQCGAMKPMRSDPVNRSLCPLSSSQAPFFIARSRENYMVILSPSPV
jgi:hypothetical protein